MSQVAREFAARIARHRYVNDEVNDLKTEVRKNKIKFRIRREICSRTNFKVGI